FDSDHEFCQAPAMSRLTRKFIAVLMLLWLPLFSGSALAASVSMQARTCHEAAMQQEMQHADECDHHHDEVSTAQNQATSDDQQDSSCNACGVCHLACSGYLAVQGIAAVAAQMSAQTVTPYVVSFHSITSTPLVPPPLARA
ncbi:MAG TPA: DUF2946 domain-containing protein, partial [Gallionella sp.]|nr:DUF2946 domain-containing protein [Gallionella sp.]